MAQFSGEKAERALMDTWFLDPQKIAGYELWNINHMITRLLSILPTTPMHMPIPPPLSSTDLTHHEQGKIKTYPSNLVC